ncbi:MAG: Uncharacterised protein [Flavobacteriales bacterium]|nr:MAG: Uncharacterised protein [Flavobacteriales bacterium]
MNKLFLFFFFLCSVGCEQKITSEFDDVKYYGEDSFIIEGTDITDSLKENKYDRLPISYKKIVRKPVWDLSKNSAGLSIRFLSNSSLLTVKWEVLNNFKMDHMPETGIKGVDLYFKNEDNWQYLNTGRPQGFINEYKLSENMTNELREYKIYLPLYDGIKKIEIGIDNLSFIKKPKKNDKKPIIFYGTSITQGCCASRPGMAHTNIISRKLDRDVINFGFSGNGMMEKSISELISESDPLFYVIECMPNMISPELITTNTIPLVDTIRKRNPDTPIILVDLFTTSHTILDNTLDNLKNEMNNTLNNEYQKMIQRGYKNIIYLESKNALGYDFEGTVDGVHFTDLGFIRYADYLLNNFNEYNLITD